METKAAEIEKVGEEWFVVVPQRTGKPLKFLCETERQAHSFLAVVQKKSR